MEQKKTHKSFKVWRLTLIGLNIIMDIITKKQDFSKLFFLHFYISGNGTEFLDYDLPIPTYQKHTNNGYYIAWGLNGYFGTKKGSEFLKDIKIRFINTFKAEICPFRPKLDNQDAKVFLKAYELKEFSQRLKSIKEISNFNLTMTHYKDEVFWKIKIYAEIRIEENGIVAYEDLLFFAESHCLEQVKDYSTLKAKCRSIWHWYNARDYELTRKKSSKTKEEIKMTRQEIAKLNTQNTIKNSKNKITVAINALKKENKLYKKNGKPNITNIAELSEMSRFTVRKYIEELLNG